MREIMLSTVDNKINKYFYFVFIYLENPFKTAAPKGVHPIYNQNVKVTTIK